MSILEFYKGKKVFITGHTGFKGSWLSYILLRAGAEVTVFSLCPPTSPSLFEGIEPDKDMCSVTGDVADLQDRFILPVACPHSDPSWFGFLLTCKDGVDRNHVVRHLEESGIQTRMLFAGNLIKHPCFDQMRKEKAGYRVVGELGNTDIVMERAFWVGVYPGMTEKKLDYMVDCLKDGAML